MCAQYMYVRQWYWCQVWLPNRTVAMVTIEWNICIYRIAYIVLHFGLVSHPIVYILFVRYFDIVTILILKQIQEKNYLSAKKEVKNIFPNRQRIHIFHQCIPLG